MTLPAGYSVDATAVLDVLREKGVTHVTTVPDYAQFSLQLRLEAGYLPQTRVMRCCTEDQAVECAAGLWIGGAKPVVVMQNNGFFASINSICAVGIDAKIPLLLLIGQWGREFRNLGKDPRESRRRPVAAIGPVLDVLGVRHWSLESPADLPLLRTAIDHAFGESAPAAVIVGAPVAW